MSSIRIIQCPPGQAPEHIRQQWIGSIIPLLESCGARPVGVLGGKPQNVGGYEVLASEAIDSLRKREKEEAVLWWRNCLPTDKTTRLVFARDVCEVIP